MSEYLSICAMSFSYCITTIMNWARPFPMFIRSSHEMEPFATPHPWHLQWSQCDHIHKTMWSFDSSFVASIKKLLNRQSICRWFEVPWHSCDVSITNFRKLCDFSITSKHVYTQQMIHECSVFIDKCPIKLVNCWSGPGRQPVYENSCSPPWNGCCSGYCLLAAVAYGGKDKQLY